MAKRLPGQVVLWDDKYVNKLHVRLGRLEQVARETELVLHALETVDTTDPEALAKLITWAAKARPHIVAALETERPL